MPPRWRVNGSSCASSWCRQHLGSETWILLPLNLHFLCVCPIFVDPEGTFLWMICIVLEYVSVLSIHFHEYTFRLSINWAILLFWVFSVGKQGRTIFSGPFRYLIKYRICNGILTLSDPTSDLVRQYDFPVPLWCWKTSDTVFVAFVHPLSEPVRRFSSCSTGFSQQIAQVALFLFLYVFLL
jgi:hypothetical protein